jgi:hypothetical protein
VGFCWGFVGKERVDGYRGMTREMELMEEEAYGREVEGGRGKSDGETGVSTTSGGGDSRLDPYILLPRRRLPAPQTLDQGVVRSSKGVPRGGARPVRMTSVTFPEVYLGFGAE